MIAIALLRNCDFIVDGTDDSRYGVLCGSYTVLQKREVTAVFAAKPECAGGAAIANGR
jgi:hypothetical protein